MSASERLAALVRDSVNEYDFAYTVRDALPEIVAVVLAAEDVERIATGLGSPLGAALAALDAKLEVQT